MKNIEFYGEFQISQLGQLLSYNIDIGIKGRRKT